MKQPKPRTALGANAKPSPKTVSKKTSPQKSEPSLAAKPATRTESPRAAELQPASTMAEERHEGHPVPAEGPELGAPGLGLTPNETVGWRIRTDDHNYTVVLVRRHGPASKFAGQAYDIPLAYCKSLAFAVDRLVDHALRAKAQGIAVDDATSGVAYAQRILDAIAQAKQEALEAVRVFEAQAAARATGGEPAVATEGSGTTK